jgi:hypothetical protein
MESPDHTHHDPHSRSRTKVVKIVDLPFLFKPTSAKEAGKAENDEGKGEVGGEDGNGVKREIEDTDVKKGKETTLKRLLMSKERVTVDGLLVSALQLPGCLQTPTGVKADCEVLGRGRTLCLTWPTRC